MTSSFLQQLKKRRLHLGLKQSDMMMRIGVSRQQYQRLESKGNPRLDTLKLVAEGLNSELMLIPKEKIAEVLAVLEETKAEVVREKKKLSEDPWQGIFEDEA